MEAFDKDMPDYDDFAEQRDGAGESGRRLVLHRADRTRTATIRRAPSIWIGALEVRSLEQDGPIVRRREMVHCELRKEKKHWKIVALKPLDFFAPAKLGQIDDAGSLVLLIASRHASAAEPSLMPWPAKIAMGQGSLARSASDDPHIGSPSYSRAASHRETAAQTGIR